MLFFLTFSQKLPVHNVTPSTPLKIIFKKVKDTPPLLPVNDDDPDVRGRLQKSVFEKIERIGQIVQRVDASVKDSVKKELNLILVRSEIQLLLSVD